MAEVRDQSTSPSPMESAAKAAASKYSGQSVIMVPELHASSDKSIEFSKQLVSQLKDLGVKKVGIEFIGPTEAELLRALKDGRVTRDEFLQANKPAKGSLPSGSPYEYLGAERANAMYETIADLVESGVEICPLGTSRGMFPFTLNEEDAKQVDKMFGISGKLVVEDIVFKKSVADWTDDTAKSKFDQMSAELEQRLDSLSASQQEDVAATLLDVRQKESEGRLSADDYKEYALDLFHHQSSAMVAMGEQAEWLTSKIGDVAGKRYDLGAERQKADPSIAKMIQQSVEESGPMVVVYGSLHTIHANDIDTGLRMQGMSVITFDLDFGKNLCHPSMPSKACEEATLVDSWSKVARRQDGDPDRYTIEVAEAGPSTVEPMKSWTAFDSLLQRVGLSR